MSHDVAQLFTPMVDVLPQTQRGIAKIEHFTVTAADSAWSYMRRGDGVPEGTYARLYVNGQLMMTDTSMEHRTNRGFVWAAKGDVLIAGLGLGMILLPALRKREVNTITVIEKYQDVIDAVIPAIERASTAEQMDKLRVVNADIYQWLPPKVVKFDCIYFDIWPNKCTDNLVQMAQLHQKFKNRLKGDRWMNSWCKEELKSRKASERGSGW